jgi:membrane-associated protease RseP (regulator of RpoE activity)
METAAAVPAGPARNWVLAAIVVGVIVLVWFLFVAPGCGSGDSGTNASTVTGTQAR